MLNFSKWFFCIHWNDHMTVNIMNYIDWFSECKLTLVSWDHWHLVTMCYVENFIRKVSITSPVPLDGWGNWGWGGLSKIPLLWVEKALNSVFPLCLQEVHSFPHTIPSCNRQQSGHTIMCWSASKVLSAVNLLRLIY